MHEPEILDLLRHGPSSSRNRSHALAVLEAGMKYYLDCEFNGMGGELLSLAVVEEHGGDAFYLIREDMPSDIDPWVAQNVLPILHSDACTRKQVLPLSAWGKRIESYLRGDPDVTIITDWPDDIRYFCELILTGPGTMIDIRPSIKFEMHRVDAYPTDLPGAIQHNAYWDAMALRHKMTGAA